MLSAIYNSGMYNFCYVAMEIVQIPKADNYLNLTYNQHWTPTCYFDGGYEVLVGGYLTQSLYTNRINNCGTREVPDLDLDVSMTFIDSRNIEFTVTVTNNNFVNFAPNPPGPPTGPSAGLLADEHMFTAAATDPDGDQLYYMWDWEGELSAWLGPYNSGEDAGDGHTWATTGTHSVRVKVKDQWDEESGWSDPATMTVVARGDANGDFLLNVADAVYVVTYIFKGGPAPVPLAAGDANCDGTVNVGDAVYLITYIFKGGPAPGCSE